jgi:hypothetical protein
VWYKMWYKSEALSASGMLNAIYIKGLRGVCGGGAVRLTTVHESSMQINIES